MGARRGEGGALAPPPWNLKKVRSYAAVLQNTPKFSVAPSALAIDTLYFTLKRREKRKMFRLRLWRAEKWSILGTARQKTCQLFNVLVVLPPSGKIPAGAHGSGTVYWRSAPDKAHVDLLPR